MALFSAAAGRLANEPAFVGGALTMMSREIAELVESRHDSLKRTIERLAGWGLLSFAPSVETSRDRSGARSVEVFRGSKRGSYVFVAQLSPEFTAQLVDRWKELEARAETMSPALSHMDIRQLGRDGIRAARRRGRGPGRPARP